MGLLDFFESKKVKNELNQLNESINETMVDVTNDFETNCRMANKAKISLCGDVQDTTFNINQVASASCKLTANALTKLDQSFKNDVEKKVKAFITNKTEDESSFVTQLFDKLGISIGNKVTEEQINNMTSRFMSSFKANVKNSCSLNIDTSNEITFTTCEGNGARLKGVVLNSPQKVIAEGLTQCAMTTLGNSVVQNNELYDAMQQLDNEYKRKETSIFGSLFMWIAIGVGGLLLLLIVGGVIFFLVTRNSGPPAPTVVPSLPLSGAETADTGPPSVVPPSVAE